MPVIVPTLFPGGNGTIGPDRSKPPFGYLSTAQLQQGMVTIPILPLETYETPFIRFVGYRRGTVFWQSAGTGTMNLSVSLFDPTNLTPTGLLATILIGTATSISAIDDFGYDVNVVSGGNPFAYTPLGFITLLFGNTSGMNTLTLSLAKLMCAGY